MKTMKTRELVEASLLVALAAILIIMSQYIPFFVVVGILMWPVPIVILTFKYNVRVSIISLAALAAIIVGFMTPLAAMFLLLLYGLPAVVLGFCLRKKYSPFITVISVAVSMFLTYILTLKLSVMIFGIDILAQTQKMLDDSVNIMREILTKAGIDQEQLNQLLPAGYISQTMNLLLPGILAIMSMVGAYLNYYVVMVIFRKLRLKINELKPLDMWYINNNLSYGLFFVIAVTGVLWLFNVSNSDIVFNSIYLIFNFIFIINGFGVVFWFLKKRGVPGKVVVFIIVVIIFINLSIIVFLLGLVDYIIDFRKINPSRRRTPPGE